MNTSPKLLDNKMLLALIGRRIPAIFDVIPRRDWAKSEPQPIPWIVVGAELGRLALQSAHAAQRAGGKPQVALDYLDDWCPVGKTAHIPWWLLKDYYHGDPPPRPEEINMQDLHLGVVMGLTTAATKLQDKALLEVVNQGIERSLGAMGHS